MFQHSYKILLVTVHGEVILFANYLMISCVQDWELAQPVGVLATTAHSFDSDPEISDVDDDDRETVFSSMDMLSPSGHSDAQTLAMMLQEQLDAINEEIRYEMIQSSSYAIDLIQCISTKQIAV